MTSNIFHNFLEKKHFKRLFLPMVDLCAKLSECDQKCGAILVDNKNRIISYGYNGETSGMGNTKDSETIVHSEQNTLIWTLRELKNEKELYYVCNRMPCNKCSSLILNFKIIGIIFTQPIVYLKTVILCQEKGTILYWYDNEIKEEKEFYGENRLLGDKSELQVNLSDKDKLELMEKSIGEDSFNGDIFKQIKNCKYKYLKEYNKKRLRKRDGVFEYKIKKTRCSEAEEILGQYVWKLEISKIYKLEKLGNGWGRKKMGILSHFNKLEKDGKRSPTMDKLKMNPSFREEKARKKIPFNLNTTQNKNSREIRVGERLRQIGKLRKNKGK